MSGFDMDDFLTVGEDNTEGYERILQNLLVIDDKNLVAQTEIHNPDDLVKLYMLARWCESEKMVESAKLIDQFIEKYLQYMISFERKSRQELVDSVKELAQKQTTAEKLMGTD